MWGEGKGGRGGGGVGLDWVGLDWIGLGWYGLRRGGECWAVGQLGDWERGGL